MPINTLKELMPHDVFDIKTHLWIRHQNPLHQISRHRVQVLGENEAAGVCHLDDLLGWHGGPTQPNRLLGQYTV